MVGVNGDGVLLFDDDFCDGDGRWCCPIGTMWFQPTIYGHQPINLTNGFDLYILPAMEVENGDYD